MEYNFDLKPEEKKEKKGILFIDKIHLNCNDNFLQIRLRDNENTKLQQFDYANITVKDIKLDNNVPSVKNKFLQIQQIELQQDVKLAFLSKTVETLTSQIESLTFENKILMDIFQQECKRMQSKIDDLEKLVTDNSLNIITWDDFPPHTIDECEAQWLNDIN